jgi:hypothetical protein
MFSGGKARKPGAKILRASTIGWSTPTRRALYEHLADLGRLMAEAVPLSELAADGCDAFAETLKDWQGRLEELGIDEGFHIAIRALQTAWDDPAPRSWPARASRGPRWAMTGWKMS